MNALLIVLLSLTPLPPSGSCAGKPSTAHPGFREQSGTALPESGGNEYGVECVCRGRERIIAFQQLLRRNANGEPVWKTLDVVKFTTATARDEMLAPPCTLRGVEDDEVVAVGRYTKTGAEVSRAYRANRARGKLEPLAAARVACQAVEADE